MYIKKDFLLVHTRNIRTNTTHLVCSDEGHDPNIMKRIGKGHLVTIGRGYSRSRYELGNTCVIMTHFGCEI